MADRTYAWHCKIIIWNEDYGEISKQFLCVSNTNIALLKTWMKWLRGVSLQILYFLNDEKGSKLETSENNGESLHFLKYQVLIFLVCVFVCIYFL